MSINIPTAEERMKCLIQSYSDNEWMCVMMRHESLINSEWRDG